MINQFHSIKLGACFFSFREGILPNCRFGTVLSACKESESSTTAAYIGIGSKVGELAMSLALNRGRLADSLMGFVRWQE